VGVGFERGGETDGVMTKGGVIEGEGVSEGGDVGVTKDEESG